MNISNGESVDKRMQQQGQNMTGGQFRQMPPGGSAQTQNSPRQQKDDSVTMKLIDAVVKTSIYFTIFLLPLFFLSKVPSFLELNKQVLLVVIVGIGFLAWVGKMAWRNEIRVKKNFIMVPVVTFVLILGASTVFSNYSEQSLWGYFGGEAKSFITTLFFAALFFLIINNVRSKQDALKIIVVFLASGFFVALYGILQIWGKFILPGEITKVNFFNTIGSVYIFGAYVGALFLLTLTLFLSEVSRLFKVSLIALAFFFFFVLIVINFKVIWIALILSMAVLFGVTIMRGKSAEAQSRVLPMIFLVLTLLMLLRQQPLIKKDLPVEVLLSYGSSTSIALNSLKYNPMLGAGPAMYSNVYQLTRPSELGDFWAVNFNDGRSYFVTLASTLGILGTLAFLFLVGAGMIYLFKTITRLVSVNRKDSGDDVAAGAGIVWFFATIILFAYSTNITFLMVWWLSLALFVAFASLDDDRQKEFVTTSETPKSSLILSFVFVLVIIGFVSAMYLQSQKYFAAVHFNSALTLDAKGAQIEEVVEELGKAIELDQNRDIYYRNLSVALFALANKRVAEKEADLSPEDSNYVSGMIKGSLTAADRAVMIAPDNSENYLSLARVYEGVLVTMEKADEKAIENYRTAIKFDPRNPTLHHKIANIYVTLADIELSNARAEKRVEGDDIPEEALENLALARESLINALALKTDYADANLLLAGIYEREGDMGRAIEKEKENKGLFPNAPGIAFRLGLLYYKNDQLENAKNEFRAAVTLDKNYANARYFLGLVLDKQGDKTGALKQFELVAKNNPDNEDLKKVIANVGSGKDALDGLGQEGTQAPIEPEPVQGVEGQPEISPDVEAQQIPEGATPEIEAPEEAPQEEETPPQ